MPPVGNLAAIYGIFSGYAKKMHKRRACVARIFGHIWGGLPVGARACCRSLKDLPMPKLTLSTHPFFLGFEQLEELMERNINADSGGYPPFNIEQTSDDRYRITLAVAGFGYGDMSITVEDRQLLIKGNQADDSEGRVFLHQGIAARQFQRRFVLADGVDVEGAAMENGLLHVDLQRRQAERAVQTIKIDRGPGY